MKRNTLALLAMFAAHRCRQDRESDQPSIWRESNSPEPKSAANILAIKPGWKYLMRL